MDGARRKNGDMKSAYKIMVRKSLE